MLKNRMLALMIVLSLLCSGVLSGCGNTGDTPTEPTEPAVSIAVRDSVPVAYVDAAYDLSSIITEEEDVEYSFEASYVDPESGETKELVVKRGKITPKVEADIQVTVTAVKGEDSSSVNVIVPINISADALDKLLISDGAAGAAGTGVVKNLTRDAAYLKAENSTSALEVSFSNPSESNDGTNLLTLSHYSLMAYFSARVWKNAAVTFWVYNPMDQDVEFKLTSYNPETYKTLLWDSLDNTQVQYAKAGQWTQIQFSLYKMGIEQVLFNAPDGLRDDVLELRARYAGSGECKIYIDGVDVVMADTIEGLETGYVESAIPEGDFSDLLSTCKVYTNETVAVLSESTNGNGTKTAYRFGADQKTGYPIFYIDFAEVTDISAFEYLKFDVYAEKCYPHLTAGIRYLDESGEEQKHGTSYDYYRDQWRTIYVNLDYLEDADLTKTVGVYFSIHMDSNFV